MNNNKCPNCGGDIAIRNPTGKCDHLYYPDNISIPMDIKTMERRVRELKMDGYNDNFLGVFYRCISHFKSHSSYVAR
jgi:hypothetical protein